MSEYRAPRGANPWRTAETALRETARTAFDEGHDSWGSRMLSGADCIVALESQLAEKEALFQSNMNGALYDEIARLVNRLAEAERTIAELRASRAVEMKVDWAEGESGPSAWVPTRIAEELELQNAKLRHERDEARRVAVWSAKHCAEAGFDRDWPAVWYTVKSSRMTRWGIPVTSLQYDGTDDDLYRALREAMGE